MPEVYMLKSVGERTPPCGTPVLNWRCIGVVLALYWCCIGVVLALCCTNRVSFASIDAVVQLCVGFC